MNTELTTPKWVTRFWQLLIGAFLLCGLLVLLCGLTLVGGKYNEFLDTLGIFVRMALHYPTATYIKDIPPSPSGKWRLKMADNHWDHTKGSELHSLKLIAWRKGQPFLSGRSLDRNGRVEQYVDWKSSWFSDSILLLDNPTLYSLETTVTLTVHNDSRTTLPYIMVRSKKDVFYFFEIPAGGSQKVSFHPPDMPRTGLSCLTDTEENYRELPSLAGTPDVRAVNITVRQGQPPEISFTPAPPAGKAP